MSKLFINVPAGEEIIEDEEMENSLFFLNLQEEASRDEYGSQMHFKTTLMSLLLKKNKLILDVEEVVEITFKLVEGFVEETETEIDAEEMLMQLVDDGYFIEIGE